MSLQEEAVGLLQQLLRLNTVNPPGNETIAALIDSSDEWIRRRCGIESRRRAAPDEDLVTMAVAAASKALAGAGVAPSTGSVGDSFDNAVAESFFGSLKTELIYRHSWASRHDAELAIFAWIEGWYNPERIIAALGMRSPDEYEAAFYADTTNLDTPVNVGNHESSLR